MKITALVENQSTCDLKTVHGLALYIETARHRILFDVGPDNTLFENCAKRGIDLSQIDIVIISHGHSDHGGALGKFLNINSRAKIYAQRKAFEKHSSKFLFFKVNIGLDPALQTHPQMVLLDGDYSIDNELSLFTVANTEKCRSSLNDTLYSGPEKDSFSHEQNLILREGENTALIMGCGHAGVVNILEKAAPYRPQICVGGYHLYLSVPFSTKTASDDLLESLAREMAQYDIRYYTCHCTGQKPYEFLAERLPNMHYLSCGDTVEV